MDFLAELENRILPADGAPGSLLRARRLVATGCAEELCASAADAVRQVHTDFLNAGARMLRTNSFAGSAPQLAKHGCEHRVGELNWLAAQLAVNAAKGSGAYVAACLGPLGDGPADQAEQRALFEEQMGALLDGGARLVLLEGFAEIEELLAALEAKHTLHHCPVIATVVCAASGEMPDGTPLATAFARLRAAEADVVGVSCKRAFDAALLAGAAPGPLAVFHGSGLPPEEFAAVSRLSAKAGVSLIGGRSGIAPEHVAAFVETLSAPRQ